ncbi:tubulin-specific chaperone A isoform X2 [Heliangelus exortis]|uniref:tubulin-specific chaperone A isoform X2 n=1 Tax=Heliangelus exortis TaxID=472823 RepID=UPI003A9551EE
MADPRLRQIKIKTGVVRRLNSDFLEPGETRIAEVNVFTVVLVWARIKIGNDFKNYSKQKSQNCHGCKRLLRSQSATVNPEKSTMHSMS